MSAPVHPKVKAATAGGAVGVAVGEACVGLVDQVFYNGSAAPDVPVLLAQLIVAVSGAAVAFAAGYIKSAVPEA